MNKNSISINKNFLQILRTHWLKVFLTLVFIYMVATNRLNISFHLNDTPNKIQNNAKFNQDNSVEIYDLPPNNSQNHTTQLNIISKQPASSKIALLQAIPDQKVMAYVERFKSVARNEKNKFGIPISITLASAILSSTAGTSPNSLKHNNHFDLIDSDDHIITFPNAWASFRQHSHLLSQGAFKYIASQAGNDHTIWARQLQRLNFKQNPKVSSHLHTIIEKYGLHHLD